MTNELKIRRKTDPASGWIDTWSEWGFRLTNDSKDLHKKGAIVAYEYQFVNSNENTYIPIRDEDDKVVRKATIMTLSIYTEKEWVQAGSGNFATVEDAWEDFVDYISGYTLEISSIAGGLSNFYTLTGELNPTPTYSDDGSWSYMTCGIQFKQQIAK